jgi:thiosulfate/3-mercaptopyruvate sulfurtransferase
VRDYVSKEQFQALLRRLGIDDSTTVVFYGDKSNWWATYAFWVFQLFGFTNTKVVDGGRAKWEQEGRPFSTDVPKYPGDAVRRQGARRLQDPRVQGRDARAQQGEEAARRRALPDEFSGKKTHMPEYPQEGVLRGGHIPARRAFRGRARRTRTARSRRPTSCVRSMKVRPA